MAIRATYGQAVGIVMQADHILRLPGDVGNATTFPFPVRYEVVDGVDPADLKRPDRARAAASRFVDAARALERSGVRCIGTGCGYLSILHRELQAALKIPTFTSSLMQVPWVAAALPPGKHVGVVTADSRALDDSYFQPLGWSTRTVPVAIVGIETEAEMRSLSSESLDAEKIQAMHQAMERLTRRFVREHPDVGALVLECTNLPPFADTIQRACGLPVFDVVTLLVWAQSAAVRRSFSGYL